MKVFVVMRNNGTSTGLFEGVVIEDKRDMLNYIEADGSKHRQVATASYPVYATRSYLVHEVEVK